MLVLTRKAGERIYIGDNILVEVLEVQGNRVRIGIDAPRGLSILRQELIVQLPAEPRVRANELVTAP